MLRDFSETAKEQALQIVSVTEEDKESRIVDLRRDRWNEYNNLMDRLSITQSINDVNNYQEMILLKNNATKNQIQSIFSKVIGIDNSYGTIMGNVDKELSEIKAYLDTMNFIVTPSNGSFNTSAMDNKFKDILEREEKASAQCLKDSLMQNVDGDLVFNGELLKEYLGKDETQLSDEKKRVLIDVYYELLKKVDIENVLTIISSKYNPDESRMLTEIHTSNKICVAKLEGYDKMYVEILNSVYDLDENGTSFAVSLFSEKKGDTTYSHFGKEYSAKIKDLSIIASYTTYKGKYEDKYITLYDNKHEKKDKVGITGYDVNIKKIKEQNEAIDKKLKQSKYKKSYGDGEEYTDKDGNLISKKDSGFSDTNKIFEYDFSREVSDSAYEGTINLPHDGTITTTVGKSEAHGAFKVGCYSVSRDGKKDFSPGIGVDVGLSCSVLDSEWNQNILGNDQIGLDGEAGVTIGEANANMDAGAYLKDENGNYNPQLYAEGALEYNAAELKGSLETNILGGGAKFGGDVKVGVGAHGKFGYKDGVLKCDLGAALGVGASVNVDVDVAGIATGAAKAASKASKQFFKMFK
ncbi:hypothetical protein [Lachnospira multipara]|uniref:hypothetical protein n=1 Tax=Lachnospira multipara TaxID=28051 RepID=UPI0004893A20|nr:hypothetical protein [Lachnospira multipara]